MKSYDAKVQEQIDQYRDTEEMHDVPSIFHAWSHACILPGLQQVFGVNNINDFYAEAFLQAASHNPAPPTFLSLGCGDGAVEIGIATTLAGRGLSQFRFVCYDLSDILLDRFRQAIPRELAGHFELQAGDLNRHVLGTHFDAIMANHSLHHMVDLEGIYKTSFDNLAEHGIFVTNDMIGRNGHMRWPEAKLFVDFFWPFLSQKQRSNVLLRRSELEFLDHDCSGEGFEGIRSQEVLPLLLDQGFSASKFFGFGGMVDVFVDRCFGPNFDSSDPDDLFLINRIGLLNEMLLDAGLIKPTMMLGYFVKKPVDEISYRSRTSKRSVRQFDTDPAWMSGASTDIERTRVDPAFAYKTPLYKIALDTDGVIKEPEKEGSQTLLREMLAALRHAQKQAAAAEQTSSELGHQIRLIKKSHSWQITAPLRKIASLIGRRHQS